MARGAGSSPVSARLFRLAALASLALVAREGRPRSIVLPNRYRQIPPRSIQVPAMPAIMRRAVICAGRIRKDIEMIAELRVRRLLATILKYNSFDYHNSARFRIVRYSDIFSLSASTFQQLYLLLLRGFRKSIIARDSGPLVAGYHKSTNICAFSTESNTMTWRSRGDHQSIHPGQNRHKPAITGWSWPSPSRAVEKAAEIAYVPRHA